MMTLPIIGPAFHAIAVLFPALLPCIPPDKAGRGDPVVVLHVDGREFAGVWTELEDAQSVGIKTDQGMERVAVEDVLEVRFPTHAAERPDETYPHTIFLNDSGRLDGRIVKSSNAGIVVDIPVGAGLAFKFECLTGILFHRAQCSPAAARVFADQLAQRQAGQDALILIRDGEPKVARGMLESLAAEGGSFSVLGQARDFTIASSVGIVFSLPASQAAPPATVVMSDGSRIGGRIEAVRSDRIELAAGCGPGMTIPVAAISAILRRSEKATFLSDLHAVSSEQKSALPGHWPMRLDKSVVNAPLTLDGRTYAKGLGVHADSKVVFRIDGQYRTFAALIGIDDNAGLMGKVVFRVEGDGRILFDSGPVAGRDPARNISVPIDGVEVLSLIVDMADDLDAGDQADWINARVVK